VNAMIPDCRSIVPMMAWSAAGHVQSFEVSLTISTYPSLGRRSSKIYQKLTIWREPLREAR
jgi:hypothetical protein